MWSFRLTCAFPIKAAFVTHCWLICLIWHLQQWVVSLASCFLKKIKLKKKRGGKQNIKQWGCREVDCRKQRGNFTAPYTLFPYSKYQLWEWIHKCWDKNWARNLSCPIPLPSSVCLGLWSSCSSGQGCLPGYLCPFIVPTSVAIEIAEDKSLHNCCAFLCVP